MHYAVEVQQQECVRILIENQAPVDSIDKIHGGNSPLHLAVDLDNEKIIEMLAKTGNRTEKDFQGLTPLLRAAQNDHLGAVYLLLRLGYSPYTRAEDQQESIFHLAARTGGVATQKFLQDYLPSEVNIFEDINGETPLHVAVRHKNHQALIFILEKTRRLETLSSSNETPLMIAIANHDYDFANIILNVLETKSTETEQKYLIQKYNLSYAEIRSKLNSWDYFPLIPMVAGIPLI